MAVVEGEEDVVVVVVLVVVVGVGEVDGVDIVSGVLRRCIGIQTPSHLVNTTRCMQTAPMHAPPSLPSAPNKRNPNTNLLPARRTR